MNEEEASIYTKENPCNRTKNKNILKILEHVKNYYGHDLVDDIVKMSLLTQLIYRLSIITNKILI